MMVSSLLGALLLLPLALSLRPPHRPAPASSALRATSKLLDTDADLAADVRVWHFMTQKRRPDDVYVSPLGLLEAAADLMRCVYASARVMERPEAEHADRHVAVVVFAGIERSEESRRSLSRVCEGLQSGLSGASYIMQPDLARSFRVLDFEDKWLVCVVDTVREKPAVADLANLDTYVPAIEDITTNALPGFPFDSVYDFISEINRPVDKTTMSSLRFRFSIADLKFDVEKVKKKKDPQEIVDGINCKLTRLAVWRDALQAVSDGPDMFTEEAQWAEKVKGRFQSMRALMQAGDPAKLLDSQYDKKATFLRIIDQWSDRLKRNFKYIYQSQREPEDFALQVLRSDWRVDLADTAAALSRAPLLDLGGPAFTPGSLQPLFEERAWPPDYAAAEALHEMLVWQRLANKVRMAADLPPSTVTRMAFVRGRTTERLLVDTFAGVEGWLRGGAADVFVRRAVMYELGLHAEAAEDDLDHTERWAACVSDLDDYVRTQSAAESRGVKDMFRGWIAEGKAFLDWFTALVRDLDLVDKMESLSRERVRPWSELIEELLDAELQSEAGPVNENAEDAEGSLALWRRYKPVLKHAEFLDQSMPWRRRDGKGRAAVAALAALGDFRDEVVTVSLPSRGSDDGFLVVAPRFFRGAALKEEYTAFLDYCSLVGRCADLVLREGGGGVRVVPLHPRATDIARRAPHPALLFLRAE